MATGVLFGSPRSLLLQPGAYSVVDASNLEIAPPFSFNVVCVMGAALGGQPMTPYLFNDPLQAQQLFGAGTPLSEAIRCAFKGGANGGAASVVGVRVDNCGQAYGVLTDSNSGTELTANFKDYGAYGNTYSLSFYPASVAGTLAVLQGKYLDGRDYVQKWDNQTSFSQLIQRINDESPLAVAITAGGSNASQTLQLATSQVDGRATVSDSQGVQRSNQAYLYQYPALMQANTTDSLLLTFNAPISWVIASIDASGNSFTTSGNHTLVPGNLIQLSGTTLPPEVDPAKTYLVYAAASATTFQIAAIGTQQDWTISAGNTNTFTAPGNTLANGDVVQISSSSALPPELKPRRNYFVVGKANDNFQIAATVGGAPIGFTGNIIGGVVSKIASAGVLDISGSVNGAKVSLLLGTAAVSASNPADFNGTRQAVKSNAAYSQAITNAVVSATAYSSDSARISLQGSDTWGNLSGHGLPGAILQIDSGVYTGTYQILYYEWDGQSADKVRVVRKLSGDRLIQEGTLSATLSFWTSFQFGRLQPAVEALETRLPANGLLATGGQYLTVVAGDQTVYYPTQIGDTIQSVGNQIVNLINQSADFPVVASAAYNPATYTSTLTLIAKTPGTVPNSYAVAILVNVQNTLLVSAGGTTLTGGLEPIPPRSPQGITSGSLLLANGFDSVPTYQRWLDGLNAIKYLPVRWLVPAGTDNIGVQTAFADHCELMSSTPQRRERLCVMGHGLGWTTQQIRDRVESFQSERVIFVSSGVTLADSITGNAKLYPAYYTAALVAGMLAAEGNGISDPITHTYLKDVLGVEINYQPGSTELDQMIDAGVLTIERDPSLTRASRGYRVTRGITTWRVTVQSALKSNQFESITVINQSDYIAAVVRESLEALFVGKALFSDTLEQIRVALNAELARRSRERIIYGYAPDFTQVSLNADSANSVNTVYKIFPAPALEFILNTQILLPISAASA